MFLKIAVNNLYVLLIYATAGLLVLYLTGSKLAPFAPWTVFTVHMLEIIVKLSISIRLLGLLPCLALVLPHAWLEVIGLSLGCTAGSRFCKGQQHPTARLWVAAGLVITAAFVETYITPFPLEQWLLIK